jgi:hypothetical protein
MAVFLHKDITLPKEDKADPRKGLAAIRQRPWIMAERIPETKSERTRPRKPSRISASGVSGTARILTALGLWLA